MAWRRKLKRGGRPKGRDNRTVAENMRWDPTPETVAKLKPDPFKELIAEGFIDTASQQAAYEIAAIYRSICRASMGKIGKWMASDGGQADMSARLANAHAKVYLPWVRAHKPQVINDVLGLVVDGREAEHPSRCCRALADYAMRMGNRQA